MQLEPQFVRIQLQEYRSNKFVKNTSKQIRVYNVPVADLMNLIAASLQKAAEPEPTPLPIAAVYVAKPQQVKKKYPKFPKHPTDPNAPPAPRRQLSQEAKDKIAATQRLRWETRSRTVAPEIKLKIGDSQRIRWANRRQTWAELQTQPVGDGMYVGEN